MLSFFGKKSASNFFSPRNFSSPFKTINLSPNLEQKLWPIKEAISPGKTFSFCFFWLSKIILAVSTFPSKNILSPAFNKPPITIISVVIFLVWGTKWLSITIPLAVSFKLAVQKTENKIASQILFIVSSSLALPGTHSKGTSPNLWHWLFILFKFVLLSTSPVFLWLIKTIEGKEYSRM